MFLRRLLLISLCCLLSAHNIAFGKKITKIVLDAGHGGKDFGAVGKISAEKNLTLAIILKLGRIITDSMKSVTPIYTRTTDVYPSLPERHDIANQAKADLFISVHINSTPFWYEKVQTGTRTIKKKHHKTATVPVYTSIKHHETKQKGAETLVIGSIRNSQKERAFGEYGSDVVGDSGVLDQRDPQTAIIISQYTQAYLGRSVALGTKIQDEFAVEGRTDLGVKQQSLEVLAGSYMPGVLVECGFITNIEEEEYMNSETGQMEIAMAIYRGIKAYKQDVEKN